MVERNLNVALNEEIAPSVQAVNVISGAKHKVIAQYYNNSSASYPYNLNTSIACNRYKLVSLVCYATEEDFGGATVTVTAYKGVPINGVNTDFAVATESLVVPAVTAGTFEKVNSSIGEADDTDSMRFSGTIEVAAGGKVTLEAVYRNVNDNAIETIQGAVAEIADNTKNSTAEIVIITDTDVEITLENNVIFNCGGLTDLEIVLPASTTADFTCQVNFTSGSTETSLVAPNTIVWLGDDIESDVFVPAASKRYSVMFYYDGVNFRGIVQGV